MNQQADRTSRTPRWISAVIMAAALGILLPGVAWGQDYEAVARRLGEAVERGEISGEHARLMIEALRRSHGPNDDHPGPGDVVAGFETRIREAVEAGVLSPEDARAQLQAMRKRLAAQGHEGDRRGQKRFTRDDLARLEGAIKEAVEAGVLSGEEARAKLQAMQRMLAEQGDRPITPEEHLRTAAAQLRMAVAAGKVSEEDARAKLEAVRRKLAAQGEQGEKRFTRDDYACIEAKVKDAVEAGKLSEQDARAKLDAMRKKLAALGERAEGPRDGAHGTVNWDAIKKRIEGAVERGDLTRAEADAKYMEIKARLKEHRDR